MSQKNRDKFGVCRNSEHCEAAKTAIFSTRADERGMPLQKSISVFPVHNNVMRCCPWVERIQAHLAVLTIALSPELWSDFPTRYPFGATKKAQEPTIYTTPIDFKPQSQLTSLNCNKSITNQQLQGNIHLLPNEQAHPLPSYSSVISARLT